jgi:hypothetical protein
MAEVLVEFNDVITAEDGTQYAARAVGAGGDSGNWHGWLEFTDLATSQTIRSGRETTQPNRTDTVYWATGLTPVYLEGALERARHPLAKPAPRPTPQPQFEEPAPDRIEGPPPESVLNPFSVYRKGEGLLRRQLAALSAWHLVNIARAYGLSDLPPATLTAMTAQDLIELIVTAVRTRAESTLAR